MKQATTLIILDGWGHNPDAHGNAVTLAKTPNFDRLISDFPSGFLTAHGPAVGLPAGQMGNSEVGHTTIGAGRVVWMDLPRIDRAIEDGSLMTNFRFQETLAKLKSTGGTAHILGLASDGGVHAHQRHIAALADVALAAGVHVVLHLFTDGRDVPPTEAQTALPKWISDLPDQVQIGSISGRFYAMDRDNRWERVQAAYDAIALAKGRNVHDVDDALNQARFADETDEFITPSVVEGYHGVDAGDALICANFRSDRAREIMAALADPDFGGFERSIPDWSDAIGVVSYSDAHDQYLGVMFPKENIQNTLGAVIAAQGRTQFRIAETEKYPHVTFFMNGGKETPEAGETRYMAPSPKVRTYDLKPEMSSSEVGENLANAIQSGEYDLIICNFANPDMVGHTGDLSAAIQACEAVDTQLGRAIVANAEIGGRMIVTADHGNCEVMIDPETGGPHTAHTLNPVRYILIGHDGDVQPEGGLADIAPTLLNMMGIDAPAEMDGKCLLV